MEKNKQRRGHYAMGYGLGGVSTKRHLIAEAEFPPQLRGQPLEVTAVCGLECRSRAFPGIPVERVELLYGEGTICSRCRAKAERELMEG